MVEHPVSRETGRTPPPAARQLALDRLDLLSRYAELLAGPGIEHGLIGPREAPRLWERHLLNCAVVAAAAPSGSQVADLGSGAGLPGLVWAIVRPDLSLTLVEPLLRRVEFLHGAIASLGLADVEVLRSRAAEMTGHRLFDVVTARAVAPLDRLVTWAMPLVRPGGRLVAFKGSSAASEIKTASGELVRMCAGEVTTVSYGEGVLQVPATAVLITKRAGGVPTREGGPERGPASCARPVPRRGSAPRR